jgi:hypothetical protein
LALLIDGRRFLIPWRKVPWVRLRTAESVTAADCAVWELRQGEWLQAMARHEAVVMSDHVSVWITGCVGSVCVSHVEAVRP